MLQLPHFSRNDEIDKVIWHEAPEFIVGKTNHVVQCERTIPRLISVINDECYDRSETICLCKSGKILIRLHEVFECDVPCAYLSLVCKQGQRIVNHVSERHGIVDCRLILDSKQDIRCLFVPINLENIPISREFVLPFVVSNHLAEQPVRRFQIL